MLGRNRRLPHCYSIGPDPGRCWPRVVTSELEANKGLSCGGKVTSGSWPTFSPTPGSGGHPGSGLFWQGHLKATLGGELR